MCILKEDLIIKEVEKKEDFKKVFKVFREYPYNELWPDIEIEEEFKKIKDIGRVIGCYYKENCIGIITFYDIIRNEHPITYGKNNKVLYLCISIFIKNKLMLCCNHINNYCECTNQTSY